MEKCKCGKNSTFKITLIKKGEIDAQNDTVVHMCNSCFFSIKKYLKNVEVEKIK